MYKDIINSIESKADLFKGISDNIWEVPETCFTEEKSSAYLIEALKNGGFEVEECAAGIKTAFVATYGKGKPVIGIAGEFDALSGLSQVAGIATKTPLKRGDAGHGCGHHLLGTAGVAAVFAVKDYLDKTGSEGTIKFFGCPAEEGGSGKAFMAREGVFNDLDVALSWHPSSLNMIMTGSSLANVQVYYRFKGVAAHAAGAPHLGRSALDAVELMNIGVQFLREHVVQEARMHYAITNPGGYSPNVVQADAEVLYLLRAPENAQVQDILRRVNKIAEGAALMTETELEIDFVKACSNTIPNFALERVIYDKMVEIGAPKFTAEEIAFADEIEKSIENKSSTVATFARKVANKAERAKVMEYADKSLVDAIMPHVSEETPMAGSTDVGDVSWCCPTAQVNTACYSANTPGHSWQLVAQGKSGPAYKGMLYAGEIMAATAIHLFENPDDIAEAKAEWKERVGDGYVCPIPKGVVPRSIAPKK